MNLKLKILRDVLLETVNNIDAGNTNKSEEELDEIINILSTLNRGVHRISKRYACDKILHCSLSTFDNYLALGLIPPGRKEVGFKELSWREKDFDEAVMYRIKEYKDTDLLSETISHIDNDNLSNNYISDDSDSTELADDELPF